MIKKKGNVLKVIILCLVFVGSLFGKYIKESELDKSQDVLQIVSCPNLSCVKKAKRLIKGESYHVVKHDEFYVVSLVNIKKDELELVRQKYNNFFSDSLKRKLISGDPLYEIKPKIKIEDNKISTQAIVDIEQNNTQIQPVNLVIEQNISSVHVETKTDDVNISKEIKSVEDKKIDEQNITKEIVVDIYTKALEAYKKRDYKESYGLLNELFLKNLNDVNINFYLGRSAYEIGMFDEAILAFDRILFEKPDTLRVQFELGRTYIAKENYLDAQKYFSSLASDPKTPNDLMVLSKKYLSITEDKISRHSLGGIFMVGASYDSNVNNSSKYDFFDYPIIGIVQNTTKKEAAFAHQEVALVSYGYRLNDNYLFKTDGLVYLKTILEDGLDNQNVKMIGISPSLNQTYSENISFDYGLFIDNLWVGGENYIQSYGVNPKMTYALKQSEALSFAMKYQIKNYSQEINKPKDSKYMEFTGSYFTSYGEHWILSPILKITNEKKQNGIQEDVDNKSTELTLNSTYLYSENLSFAPSLVFKKTIFDTRDEKQYLLKFGSTYLYAPQWIIQGDISYLNQSSTHKAFEYNKYNFTLNLIRPF